MSAECFTVARRIEATPRAIFTLLCTPAGHVAIDSSGMLQSAAGDPVGAVGDSFVVHMDREALNDMSLGKYDVTVVITQFEPDAHIEWTVTGEFIQPPIGHRYGYRLSADGDGAEVSAYYDWSGIAERYRKAGIFPVIPEAFLRATLGILARTVEPDSSAA